MEALSLIGGSILSAFFQLLFEKLSSHVLLKYAEKGQVLAQLNEWRTMLKKIDALVYDAEEKQMTDNLVKMWVSELRDLAYDVEDILDDIATNAERRKLALAEEQRVASTGKLIRKFMIPSCFAAVNPTTRRAKLDAEMISEIKSVTTRLEHITAQKNALGLRESSRDKVMQQDGRPPTTSLVTEAKVYGREKDKEAILKILLRSEARHDGENSGFLIPKVISIIGMGGLGKTTLAQLIYNDSRLDSEFDPRAWVSVGENFDVWSITKTIFHQMGGCHAEDLNSLHVALKVMLSEKKFLIVLDGVWNEDYDKWALFLRPFEAGKPGSSIIVTTRNQCVSDNVAAVEAYTLNGLSHDDCLSVFAQHALGAKNFDEYLNLKQVGEKIVDRCQGLPLAARALGVLLRGQPNYNVWEQVLNSKIWDLPKEKSILPALRLSYNHLPSHLKRCFAYCAVLPKAYEFDKGKLVLLWMAEGLLQQPKGKKKMEDIGLEYFDDLLSRSFFQQLSGEKTKFVMHDLIIDLARFVAAETCFDLDDDLEGNDFDEVLKKVRHSTFFHCADETSKRLELICNMKQLRTFVATLTRGDEFTDELFYSLPPKLKCLRVLSMSIHDKKSFGVNKPVGKSQFLKSVDNLNHLRYLDLSGTSIKSLPESVSALLNLQTLLLYKCTELIKLPAEMKNLIKLRHFDISGTTKLHEMPAGIGNLVALQGLSKFIVGKGNGLTVRELKELVHLQGKLSIRMLHNVVDAEDAKVASLKNKDGVDRLVMKWSENFHDLRNARGEMLVLDSLQPHKNLKNLKIAFYGGNKFPSWMEDPTFANLLTLKFIGCRRIMSLPSLGQLPLLRNLTIQDMDRVETVGIEFYGHSKPFQSLETLLFENMSTWETWTSHEVIFPRLRLLKLQDCPKLKGELIHSFPSLEDLLISQCPRLNNSLISLPSLHRLYLGECNEAVLRGMVNLSSLTSLVLYRISGLACLHEELIGGLGALKFLQIQDCNELASLWKDGAQMESLACLNTVVLVECPRLVSSPITALPHRITHLRIFDPHKSVSLHQPFEDEGTMSIFISDDSVLLETMVHNNIKRLSIANCRSLKRLTEESSHNLTHLSRLTISGCESGHPMSAWGLHRLSACLQHLDISDIETVSFPDVEGLLPTTLIHLSIHHIRNLESISRGLLNLTSLEQLDIFSCEKLRDLPDEGLPVSLQRLEISGCPLLEERCLKEEGDYWPIIAPIPSKQIGFEKLPTRAQPDTIDSVTEGLCQSSFPQGFLFGQDESTAYEVGHGDIVWDEFVNRLGNIADNAKLEGQIIPMVQSCSAAFHQLIRAQIPNVAAFHRRPNVEAFHHAQSLSYSPDRVQQFCAKHGARISDSPDLRAYGFKKIVLKLDLLSDKSRRKAMKMVTAVSGVDSVSVNLKLKTMTVIGAMDPVRVVEKLRQSY